MIGVMALIVIPIFMILSSRKLKESPEYRHSGMRHIGRYMTLFFAVAILFGDFLVIYSILT